MATQLGALVLDVVARVGGFTNGMNQAQRSAAQASNSINQSMGNVNGFNDFIDKLKNMKGALLGIGATAASIGAPIAAMYSMASAAAEADLKLLILSDRLSTSVEDLQKLSGAAAVYGYEQEQVADILGDFQEKLGEFTSTDGGGANDFFEMLTNNTKLTGKEIKELAKTMSGKSGVEAIQILKNNLDQLGASTQEQRFVLESFASELSNMAPIFANNGKVFNEYGKQLEEYGIIKPLEAVEASAQFAAQQMTVKNQLNGLKTQVTQAFLPMMSQLIKQTSESASGFFTMDDAVRAVSIGAKIAIGSLMALMGVVKLILIPVQNLIQQVRTLADTAGAITMAEGLTEKLKATVNGGKQLVDNYKQSWVDAKDVIESTVLSVDKLARTDFSKTGVQLDAQSQRLLDLARGGKGGGGSGIGMSVKDAEEAKKAAESVKKENEKSNNDFLKQQQEFEKAKSEMKRLYMTADENDVIEHNERLRELNRLGLKSEFDMEVKLFKDRQNLKELELELELESFKMTELEKLELQTAIEGLRIKSSAEFSEAEKRLRLSSLGKQYSEERKELERANDQKLKDHKAFIKSMQDQQALADFARAGGVNSEIGTVGINRDAEIRDSFDRQAAYEENLKETIENVTLRDQMLLEAEQAFNNERVEINRKAEADIAEIRNNNAIAQLGMYQTLFGDLGSLVGGFVGQNSEAYRAIFAAQKAFTFASVLLSNKKALAEAWASAAFPYNLPAVAKTIVQNGILTAGIQAIGIQGMAHDGIDNIPGEGTWLLDKGERVVDSRTNGDLKKFLDNQQQAKEQQAQAMASFQNNIIIDQDSLVGSYLQSSKGDKIFNEYVKNNSTKIRRIIGA